MKDIEKWIDNLFENTIPDEVVAMASGAVLAKDIFWC